MREPSWSPDGDRIVFRVLFGLRILDASGETTLLAIGDARHPAWSPLGSTIAFESTGNVWLLPAAGGVPTQLTSGGGNTPAWSPDETRIAYAADDSIWIVSVSGGAPRKLTNGGDPAWSRDGKWIAFASNRAGNADIWVIAATGGTAVRVTTDPAPEHDPTWSPDGRSIAYTRIDGPYCSCVWIASDLPDFTTPVSTTSWSKLKTLYRE